MKKGDKIKFRADYIMNSGIIISTRSVGVVVSFKVMSDSPIIEEELVAHFETNGIVFPVVKYFSRDFTPESLFEVVSINYQ
jgi:hypothetical protein